MIEKYDPDNIMVAIIHLKELMPILVGDDWSKIADDFNYQLDQLKSKSNGDEKRDSAIAIVEMLENYSGALSWLRSELDAVNIARSHLLIKLKKTATTLKLSDDQLNQCLTIILQTLPPEIQSNQTKHIRLKPFGMDGATSIKLKNIDLSIFQISSLAAAAVTTSIGVSADHQPLLIAMGILSMTLELTKVISKDIDEQEASVYWGFIMARNAEWFASLDDIVNFTNRARKVIHFKQLEEDEVIESLNKLRSMKVVKKVPNTLNIWHIEESFSIKHD